MIDREVDGGWCSAASAPRNHAWQVDRRKCDAWYPGLGPLISLVVSADAASVHHRRHAVVSPNQDYSQGVRSGYAYAPDGPAAPYNQFNEPYFGASQGYAPGEKERFLGSVRSGG